MKLSHVLLPCKMTSTRIPRKNLKLLAGRSLLDRGIDFFQKHYPDAMITVATEDRLAAKLAGDAGCYVLPLTQDDVTDKRNLTELFNDFISVLGGRCCWHQLTSPIMFPSELDKAILDPRPYCRSAWAGKIHLTDSSVRDWLPLSQDLPEQAILTGNFGVANGMHVVTPEEDATELSPVSWVSALDINTPEDWQSAEWLQSMLDAGEMRP